VGIWLQQLKREMSKEELRDKVMVLFGESFKVSDYDIGLSHVLSCFHISNGNTYHVLHSVKELTGILDVIMIEHRQEFYKKLEEIYEAKSK
jgi:hypothetical protein